MISGMGLAIGVTIFCAAAWWGSRNAFWMAAIVMGAALLAELFL